MSNINQQCLNPMPIKVGDLVRLKSGGSPMTVIKVNNDSVAVSYWGYERNLFSFGSNQATVIRDCFPPECLELA